MSKEMGVISLGVFVIISPYLGVPNSWHTFLLFVAGAALTVLGFLLRGEALSRGIDPKGSHRHHPFVQNTATVVQDYSESEHQDTVGSLN